MVMLMTTISNLGHLPPIVKHAVLEFVIDAVDFRVQEFATGGSDKPKWLKSPAPKTEPCSKTKVISIPGKIYQVTKTIKEGM